MRVSVLYFDGCPNWHRADERLRAALAHLGGSDAEVEYRNIASAEQAEAENFRGSPTVLVDGRDPFADPDAPVGLTCRLYKAEHGVAGSPTFKQLVEVLRLPT